MSGAGLRMTRTLRTGKEVMCVKVVVITEAFEVEVRPTTKASLDTVRTFVQSLTDLNGERRGPGRPRKNGQHEPSSQSPTAGGPALSDDDELVRLVQ
jgi:hypothetical protein